MVRIDLEKYMLPPQLAAALSTGRPELVAGMDLPPSMQAEVFRLIGDLIADRAKLEAQLTELNDAFEEATSTIDGNLRRVARALAEVGL